MPTLIVGDLHFKQHEILPRVSELIARLGAERVVFCGDLCDDWGATGERALGSLSFMADWLREARASGVRADVLLGNHDCLGTGNQTYEAIYGNPDFSFIAGKVKFVCLNTNAIEYDYSRPVPNFDFMEAERSADSLDFDRTVVCMHAPPYSEQFNNNVAKVFNYYIHEFPRLLFCLDGHGHHTKKEDLYNNGTLFYMASSVHFRQYYIFTITPKDYHVEVIDF